MQDHYTTNTICRYPSAEGARVELARQCYCSTGFQPAPVAHRVALPFVSSPTRIRTWNAWLEARNDHPFHHQAISGRQGNRTLITQLVNLLSRQTQRTSIWLPSVCVLSGVTENRTRRVSGPQVRHAIAVSPRWTITPIHSVDRRGIEPRLPECKSGVFPLDQQPVCLY